MNDGAISQLQAYGVPVGLELGLEFGDTLGQGVESLPDRGVGEELERSDSIKDRAQGKHVAVAGRRDQEVRRLRAEGLEGFADARVNQLPRRLLGRDALPRRIPGPLRAPHPRRGGGGGGPRPERAADPPRRPGTYP